MIAPHLLFGLWRRLAAAPTSIEDRNDILAEQDLSTEDYGAIISPPSQGLP
jgi:hypothetical protein